MEESFFRRIRDEHGGVAEKTARSLLSLTRSLQGEQWGVSSFRCLAPLRGRFVSLYSVDVYGRLWVGFPNLLRRRVPAAVVEALANDLAGIKAFEGVQPDPKHYAIRKLGGVFRDENEVALFATAMRRAKEGLAAMGLRDWSQ